MDIEKKYNFPKWNWGAFLFTWIWGISNKTYVGLLMFVPICNVIVPFVLGANGYKWAWKNKDWNSKEEFLQNQKEWQKWSLIVWGSLILMFAIIFFGMFAATSESEPIVTAVEIIKNDENCQKSLGDNIRKGFGWTGSINISGTSGSADLSFRVKGDAGKANCYLKAEKSFGEWGINILVVKDNESGEKLLVIDNR